MLETVEFAVVAAAGEAFAVPGAVVPEFSPAVVAVREAAVAAPAHEAGSRAERRLPRPAGLMPRRYLVPRSLLFAVMAARPEQRRMRAPCHAGSE